MDKALLSQQHPLYTTWAPTWRLLANVYEGDGGFLDGSFLVPHPREQEYERVESTVTTEGGFTTKKVTTDYTKPVRDTQKFKRRKALARYENFAAIILDTLLAYLYSKQPARTIKAETKDQTHPLRAWWENIDGEGTHIDDFMPSAHLLAALFGHVALAVDRPQTTQAPLTKADQPAPYVRVYSPLDIPDWIATRSKLAAVKFIEAVERKTLEDAVNLISKTGVDAAAAIGDGSRAGVRYRFWNETSWELYDESGTDLGHGQHEMGEVPVLIMQGRKRALFRVIGRSIIGDPRLYKDHYNLLSEQRELERDQTFAILNIVLGENEDVDSAKALAGDTIGTSCALFTRGNPAEFIAPDNGPLDHYEAQILALERKIYRMIGLPWEGDSKQAETAEARKIKALDLNRLLAAMGDEAERIEYGLSRLYFIAQSGPERGQKDYDAAQLSIKYPDEFQTQEILDVIEELRAKLSAGLGDTANKIAKRRALPVLLPDLTDEDTKKIEDEIETEPSTAGAAAMQFREDVARMVGQKGQPEAGEGAPVQ